MMLQFKITLVLGLITVALFVTLSVFALKKRKIPRLLIICLSCSTITVFLQLCRFATYSIPANSMLPTVHIGDYIGVNRFAYGFRLPWIYSKPIFGDGNPKRGDVVVFLRPERQFETGYDGKEAQVVGLAFIKRCVGLPGDIVSVTGQQLSINGKAVEMKKIGTFNSVGRSANKYAADLFQENLLGTNHQTLHSEYPQLEGEWSVPEGHYFVMGDNRDGSSDSRDWGFVPKSHLIGRADVVWFNTDFSRGWAGLKERISVPLAGQKD
jgi:signal peptidase I